MNTKMESNLYYQSKPLFDDVIILAAGLERGFPQYLIEELRNTAENLGLHLNYQESRRLLAIHQSEQSVLYQNLVLESNAMPTQFMDEHERKEYFDTVTNEMEVQKSAVRNWITEKIKSGELNYAETDESFSA